MEDRIVAAVAILFAMLSVAIWLVARKLIQRERFKQRQLGRGKDSSHSTLEPAE
jgi:hypothetical protein